MKIKIQSRTHSHHVNDTPFICRVIIFQLKTGLMV